MLLSRKTTHCSNNHELESINLGSRPPPIPASSVKELRSVGWCDVCIEPWDQDERYRCHECDYDVCWRCHEQGRENYLVCMEFLTGALESEVVYGTLDVLKKNFPPKVDLSQESEVCAMGLLTLDFEMNGLTWGRFPDELRALKLAKAYFSPSTGKLTRFELLYKNRGASNDFEAYGRRIDVIGFNTGFDEVPLDKVGVSETNPHGGWVGVLCSTDSSEEPVHSFGTVTCERFRLGEIPNFSGEHDGEDKSSSVSRLLQSIAKHKRQVMDPMRNKGSGDSAKRWFGNLGRLMKPYTTLLSSTQLGKTKARKLEDERQVERILSGLDLNKYAKSKQSGKVHHHDLVYAARLSLLAYLTDRIDFCSFFPANREIYLLDPIWINFLEQLSINEGKELLRGWLGSSKNEERNNTMLREAHSMFVGRFVSTFFEQDWESPEHGKSLPLQEPLKDLGLHLLEPPCGKFAVHGIEGFVAVSDNITELGGDLCIVFQGTNGLGDVLVDFNGVTTPFEPLLDGTHAGNFACLQGRGVKSNSANAEVDSKLRVHLGFYNAFLSVKPFIEPAVRHYLEVTPKHLNVRIVVTGHSLGGSLANLCTAWLMQLFEHPELGVPGEITGKSTDRLRILCVSFGSPKIGISTFVDWMDKHPYVKRSKQFAEDGKIRVKILRMVDVQDPIATLPPSSGLFDYMHTSRSGATIDLNGNLLFFTQEDCKRVEATSRGLGIIAKKGSSSMLHHDLFVYLDKCLHFAWNLSGVGGSTSNEEEEEEGELFDWENGPLKTAFGGEKYRYDEFTQSKEFLELF